MKKRFAKMLLSLTMVGGLLLFGATDVNAKINLFTPYTGLSVTPGENLRYSINVNNSGASVQSASFSVNGLPKDWISTITSGGKDIRELSLVGGGEQAINLEIDIPLQVEKGIYEFDVIAHLTDGSEAALPIFVEVAEEGTFDTELNVDQPNLEGHTSASFSYKFTLRNRTANEQNFSLSAQAPAGWFVQFKSGGDNVTAITIESGEESTVNVDVIPSQNAIADTYEIPIQASASGTSAEATLEAVITGTYDIELTTPDGRLSTDVTAGKARTIDLVVKNTGTVTLNDIELTSSTPPNWETEFEERTIQELEAGESKTITARLTATDDAIAGDYQASFSADTDEVSSIAVFRVSVETSTLWGLVGIAIIVAVFAGLFFLFRKYGRR